MRNNDSQERVAEARKGFMAWKPPKPNWYKYNVGSAWLKENRIGGGAWMPADSRGKVMLHSRRAFLSLPSKIETKFHSFCGLWKV